MQLKLFIIVVFSVILAIFFWHSYTTRHTSMNDYPIPKSEGEISYIPIGDSYTIGSGVAEKYRWPNILVRHLKDAGINIRLVANPAVSGYTVQDAIDFELPKAAEHRPDLVTVLIGANDNFRGTSASVFAEEFSVLLDELEGLVKNPRNIVLVTLPDYSYSPAARGYNKDRISESIAEYNQVIKSEGVKRDLRVADIYPVSQSMTGEEDFISDGLHPSAAGYRKWEEVIYPVVLEALK